MVFLFDLSIKYVMVLFFLNFNFDFRHFWDFLQVFFDLVLGFSTYEHEIFFYNFFGFEFRNVHDAFLVLSFLIYVYLICYINFEISMSDFNLFDMLYVFIMFNARGFFIKLNGGGWAVYDSFCGYFVAVLGGFKGTFLGCWGRLGWLLGGCWGDVEGCLFFFVN